MIDLVRVGYCLSFFIESLLSVVSTNDFFVIAFLVFYDLNFRWAIHLTGRGVLCCSCVPFVTN